MQTICAWCKKSLESKSDSGHPVSHGMCAECEARILGERPKGLRSLLDHFDAPVMAIDQQGCLRTANQKVEKLLQKKLPEMEDQLGGDLMECAYAQLPGGCGNTKHCPACTIRNTVMNTYNTGRPHSGVHAILNRRSEQGIVPVRLQITTVKSRDIVILRIEEMSIP